MDVIVRRRERDEGARYVSEWFKQYTRRGRDPSWIVGRYCIATSEGTMRGWVVLRGGGLSSAELGVA